MAVALVLSGCQTYRSRPLDTSAHLADWSQRSPSSENVRAFAERLAVAHGRRGAFDVSDGVSVDEAEAVALVYNADLRVLRASSSVAETIARNAGRWSDPVLGIDGERIIESVANPWVLGAQIGLTIPTSGRLRAEIDKASAEHRTEIARLSAAEWNVRVQLRTAWVRWSADRARIESLRGFLQDLVPATTAANRLAEAGEINRIEARLFEAMRVSRETELRTLTARAEDSEVAIKHLMGLRPDAPLDLVPQVSWDLAIPGELEFVTTTSNPILEVRRQQYEVAERTLRLEVKKQFPDLLVSPGFKQDEGTSRGLLSVALPIPLWNRNRPAIAEACARRDLARTEYGAELERVLTALARAQIRLRATTEIRERIEHDLVPLGEAQRTDLARLVELRQFDPLLVLPALQTELDIRSRLVDARLEEALAAIEIEGIAGPSPALVENTAPTRPVESRP